MPPRLRVGVRKLLPIRTPSLPLPTSPTSRTSYSLRDPKSAPPQRRGPLPVAPLRLKLCEDVPPYLLQPLQTSLEAPQTLLEPPNIAQETPRRPPDHDLRGFWRSTWGHVGTQHEQNSVSVLKTPICI